MLLIVNHCRPAVRNAAGCFRSPFFAVASILLITIIELAAAGIEETVSVYTQSNFQVLCISRSSIKGSNSYAKAVNTAQLAELIDKATKIV
jgi:hypothetical protein